MRKNKLGEKYLREHMFPNQTKKLEGAYICLQQQEGSTFSVHTKNRKTSRKCLTIANYVFDVAPLSFDFADMTLDTAPLIIYEWCLLGAVSTFSCLHGRIRTQRGKLIKSCHKHKAKESEKTRKMHMGLTYRRNSFTRFFSSSKVL